MIIIWILGCVGGFALLWKGGDFLVDGATALARHYKVSELVIGFTIVAFGTSFPELIVNGLATVSMSYDIVFGNVIGSNIANTLLILGVTALVGPVVFTSGLLRRDFLLTILASFVFIGACLIHPYHQFVGLTAINGALFLGLLGLFLWIICRAKPDELLDHSHSNPDIWIDFLRIGGGLLGLFIGGRLVIFGAQNLAHLMGISTAFISLFVVSIGTSLPELVTCVVAIRKQRSSLLIGNILGSNVFNLLFVMGMCSFLRPIPLSSLFGLDILVMITALFFILFLVIFPRYYTLTRWKGICLVLTYIMYIGFIYMRG